MEDQKIQKLLEEYQKLVGKLNDLNDAINEVGTDQEDMIPGHDEGQEFYAKMIKYKLILAQINSVKKDLRELGYQKAL